ncbi:hypothetical protein VTN02DRAFT_2226 [Thermoascus thermophilus]
MQEFPPKNNGRRRENAGHLGVGTRSPLGLEAQDPQAVLGGGAKQPRSRPDSLTAPFEKRQMQTASTSERPGMETDRASYQHGSLAWIISCQAKLLMQRRRVAVVSRRRPAGGKSDALRVLQIHPDEDETTMLRLILLKFQIELDEGRDHPATCKSAGNLAPDTADLGSWLAAALDLRSPSRLCDLWGRRKVAGH